MLSAGVICIAYAYTVISSLRAVHVYWHSHFIMSSPGAVHNHTIASVALSPALARVHTSKFSLSVGYVPVCYLFIITRNSTCLCILLDCHQELYMLMYTSVLSPRVVYVYVYSCVKLSPGAARVHVYVCVKLSPGAARVYVYYVLSPGVVSVHVYLYVVTWCSMSSCITLCCHLV